MTARVASPQPRGAPRVGFFAHALFLFRLDDERRHPYTLTVAIDGDEGQKRAAGELTPARERLLRVNLHLHFKRRRERASDARVQDDQVADFDRMEELQIVDGRGDEQAARVAMTRDRPGDVDEVHHGAAENE